MTINNLLTISIPVFNDHDLLIDQLNRLKNQLQKGVIVNVFDNGSIPSIESVIEEKINDYKDWVTIYVNKINIGGDANILKCFSQCETKWLWVLSINDSIENDAISKILLQTNSNKKAVLINFVEGVHVNQTIGFEDFCKNVPSYTRAFFISVCIYNVEILNKYLFINNNVEADKIINKIAVAIE